ncbi:PxKF domain-containing protein [Arthrobacter cavernae]|uniref:PxKF domain-containing protein n=1 Tax=Arthrobacter cavernae TaxID=2817681 RepID=A0A939KL11_9MICC|nr:PxKF domain-containing protein [Arthrobacter cavernae]MBO1269459.1 PxKF domain-containing protein [Arthrobacter cavernae]
MVGPRTFTVRATDNANHETHAVANYRVAYDFEGFSAPVDTSNILNVVTAGRAVPLKWRLLDASGAPVTNLATASVTVTALSCSSGTTPDQLEEYAAGSSGLQNLGNGYYAFNWKTPQATPGHARPSSWTWARVYSAQRSSDS